MFKLGYLMSLIGALGCLMVIDRRWRLVFWKDARRAWRTISLGWLGFVCWDALGIAGDIFYRGESPYLTGVVLGPEFPLEEAFFLLLLVYLPLLLWEGLKRRKGADHV